VAVPRNEIYPLARLPISLLYVGIIPYFAVDEITQSCNIAPGQVKTLAD
jgi:hypothetical protein